MRYSASMRTSSHRCRRRSGSRVRSRMARAFIPNTVASSRTASRSRGIAIPPCLGAKGRGLMMRANNTTRTSAISTDASCWLASTRHTGEVGKKVRSSRPSTRLPGYTAACSQGREASRRNRMRARTRLHVLLALAASLVGAAITTARSEQADPRFSNPTRFVPQTGEALYADICQGCHMPGGVGAVGAGSYPALAKNPKLAVTGYVLSLVINGRKGMPPFGGLLTDQQVAAVVTYVRTHFGNEFSDEVTAAEARASRPR